MEESKKKNKEDKYGDDEVFESWADLNIFAPIATNLVDPLHKLGMTPNMVTIASTMFTLLSIYFLYKEKRELAFCSYLFGYTLDSVDGRMARKYNEGSEIGMALDLVSDNVSNFILFGYILLTRPYNKITIIILIIIMIMTYMVSLSYGLNEAISSYDASFGDNFYERRNIHLKKYLNEESSTSTWYEKILYSAFLLITEQSYTIYHMYFPKYDKNKINNKLKVLKHFGPGNYCLIISIILLYI